MSNRTSCFSLKNYNNSCCLAEAIEMKYKTHLSATIVSSIVFIVLSPVAIVANSLIFVAIWKGRSERTWFHIILGGLAFCDFCTGLLVQPFLGVGSLLFFVNPGASSDKKYLAMAIIGIGFLSASFFSVAVLLLVTILSIERWMHMRRRLLMTHFRQNVIVAVIVIFPVPITVSNAVQFRGLETTNKVSFAFIGVFMLLCYLITFFAYFKVYRIIRQHQQQIHETQSQGFEQSTTNLAKYKRSVKSVLYIFTFFSLTFFPVFAVVAFMLSTEDISCLEASAAYYIAHVIYFLSPSLSAALYVWRMNDIRNQVKNLFC